ncbi:uncharacterized protein RAG0_17278 [Rhynchosporium agropyri]|uniref:BTB domain-containing protein n=1 Tax=Rhynchosporium agropyri TaxID=914238 RepID=A0A1E1LTD5_9HELO|nr:uncharacterized protein RAG0_17278 [Rhynchosporium agropyri]
MPATFEEILISRSFKFIIGLDEVPIVVHEAVLAEQSPALAVLMRGEMAESVAGESRWTDVDKETFIRFAQFAYTGDYSISKGSTARAVVEADSSSKEPLVLNGSSLVPRSFALEPEDEWLLEARSKKKKKNKNGPLNLCRSGPEPPTSASEMFKSLKYPLIESRSNLCTCKSSIDDSPIESSCEVLLAHASLYVLAEE